MQALILEDGEMQSAHQSFDRQNVEEQLTDHKRSATRGKTAYATRCSEDESHSRTSACIGITERRRWADTVVLQLHV